VVKVPDVRAIRRHLKLSQHEFSRAYRIPLATLKKLGARPTPAGRAGSGLFAGDRAASEDYAKTRSQREPLKFAANFNGIFGD
jgi:hypothetical protein